MSRWIDVGSVYHLMPGSHCGVDAHGHSIAVFNVDGDYYAIEDTCPSDGLGVSGGEVRGDEIVCPRHGEHYSIKTGAARELAQGRLAVLPVRVAQGRVQVEIEIKSSYYL